MRIPMSFSCVKKPMICFEACTPSFDHRSMILASPDSAPGKARLGSDSVRKSTDSTDGSALPAQTSLKMLYWSMLIYDYEEVRTPLCGYLVWHRLYRTSVAVVVIHGCTT